MINEKAHYQQLQAEIEALKQERDMYKAIAEKNSPPQNNFDKENSHQLNNSQDTETELHQYQKNFNSLIDSIDSFLFILNEKAEIIAHNKTAIERLGYSGNELKGKKIASIHPEKYNDEITTVITEVLQGKRDMCTIPLVTKTNQNIEVNTYVKHSQWQGKPAIFCLSKDVSELKLKEEKLDLFTNIVKHSTATIVITDVKGQIIYCNPAFTQTTGYTFKEAQGQNPRILKSDATAPEVYTSLWKTITKREVWHGEFINRRKNGELYHEKATISAIINNSNNISGYFAIKEDISKQVANKKLLNQQFDDLIIAKEQLEKSEQALKRVNATKDKFFSIIAHDLRSPFTAIIGLLKILYDQHLEYDFEQQQHLLKMIIDSSTRTFKLLENLLFWAKAQSGNLQLTIEQHDINSIISESILDASASAKAKEIILYHNYNSAAICNCDKEMISTVIRNFISNALKFTPRGGNIKIDVSSDTYNTTIAVTDTGVGISPKTIDKLFDITEKTTNVGTEDEKGTGLGLILCKEFIEAHSGQIYVESTIGKGTSIMFTIPNTQNKK